MAFFRTEDNIAAIAHIIIRERCNADLVRVPRWVALDLVKTAVRAAAASCGDVYSWEEGNAVQSLMRRVAGEA